MTFSKSFKAPDPIPPQGIVNAIRLMESGQLYRYNFDLDITENTDIASLDNELASEVTKLEAEFSRYTGHKYVVAVNSCGSALFLALKALALPYQKKVFTNAFTFTAVPSSIVHAGGIPVYLECNHQYLIDIDDLENKIQANPDVKYMIVSHMRGHVSDMDAIQSICREADLTLIEDCAHSLGAEWCDKTSGQSRMIGHHGKIACFSSQSYKHLNSGEGGFIATNDEKIAAYCILGAGSYESLYRKHLSRPFDDTLFETLKPHVPNFSLRMSNLTAVVLRPQITQLEEKIAKCNLLYKVLTTILAPARNIYIPSSLEQITRAPDSLQFTLLKLTRSHIEKFVRYTAERGVKIQVFGHIDNARYFKAWKYSFESSPSLPQTEDILSCTCDIKVHSQFTPEDIREIGYIIKDVLYKVIKEERPEAEFKDYEYGLADHFEDIDSVVSKYDSWSQIYDEEHLKNGWKILLNYLAYSMSKQFKSDDLILDVGCGTGLLGQELNSYGFHDLNGIDISSESLRIAEKLGVYKNLEYAELGKALKFPNNAFDALLSIGVFTRNQVPLNAFDELIRILKPRGLLLIVLRIEDNGFYYKKLKEYYRQGLLQEISVEKISVLESCSHEIVTMRKIESD